MKVLVPVPRSYAATDPHGGTDPHPNCRCVSCDPVYDPGATVEVDVDEGLFRAPQAGSPQPTASTSITYEQVKQMMREASGEPTAGMMRMLTERLVFEAPNEPFLNRSDVIGKAEARAAFDTGRGDDYTVVRAPGVGQVNVNIRADLSQFSYDMDAITDALVKSTAGALDTQVVRAAARLAAAGEEERVKYRLVTGEDPPAKANHAHVKAALDYYLATGMLPQPVTQPVPVGIASRQQAAVPERPRCRRAMKLRGRIE